MAADGEAEVRALEGSVLEGMKVVAQAAAQAAVLVGSGEAVQPPMLNQAPCQSRAPCLSQIPRLKPGPAQSPPNQWARAEEDSEPQTAVAMKVASWPLTLCHRCRCRCPCQERVEEAPVAALRLSQTPCQS